MNAHRVCTKRTWMVVCCLAGLLGLMTAGPAAASTTGPLMAEFETELVSLDLTGGPYPLPLVTDPTNLLGDSVEGYGFLDCEVTVTLSSQRPVDPGPPSLGAAIAIADTVLSGQTVNGLDLLDPAQLDGELFHIDSFFDVFVDVTVTDVDARPGRNIIPFEPLGATGTALALHDVGPAPLPVLYDATFDAGAPQFGLFPPPQSEPFGGQLDIRVPLGIDINRNGEDDMIKLTLGWLAAQDENRVAITLPDGTVIHEYDSAGFLGGVVADESADPPFTIGGLLSPGQPDPAQFGGPTTASSLLLNPVLPEPATLSVLLLGALVAIVRTRRR